ncbi:MAG TPA: hypothetical protein VK395_09865 [Gemmataceae bacterium]|nr:hypothetical protein [Gemmataceae bacterium]
MDERYAQLDRVAPLQGMIGYLNFGSGRPDARFQKQISDSYGFLAKEQADEPWKVLQQLLQAKLDSLQSSGGSAFRDVRQAQAVLILTFTKLLAAYRHHHADLLVHLSDQALFEPFFLARAFEAVLAQGPPWDEEDRIISGALAQLDDYVGHRPIAILESRPRGEPYDHERVRPIPLFIRGAGVAQGRCHDLIAATLTVLESTDRAILAETYFDLTLLDELAVDPRAYDHAHPVNRRPNYVFGEWDPHHIDEQGRFRRYVVRQVTLDALLDRVQNAGGLDPTELLTEAGAVLAGTMLMAAGTSGSGPGAHDSSVTLAILMPRIAHYRDAFYASLLETVGGTHGQRLRLEAAATRQPFGGARQHLNQYLARHRAAQLQQRQLALLFADMGYPDASRQEAARIPATSIRLQSEILGCITTGQLLADQGELASAVRLIPRAEELLRRGIACGAFADPWNILGFQGLFPLFNAREDSIRDTRIDELVQVIENLLNLYSRLISEAAAAGEKARSDTLLSNLRRLATWWDQFASVEVSDVRHVFGRETVASAEHVATALACWHERGETAADLAFWREHLPGFQSSKAFALVVDALLRKKDYRAALGLLMNWLSQAERVPLEDGNFSFHTCALRWMLSLAGKRHAAGEPAQGKEEQLSHSDVWALMKRFFDHLEANADEYWQVPALELLPSPNLVSPDEDDESLYSAAYAEVTYQDSTDDRQEGTVADHNEFQGEFDLELEAERITHRLRFLSTVAKLWQIAVRHGPVSTSSRSASVERTETLNAWLSTARNHHQALLVLLEAINQHRVPEPLGSFDSLVEYDRRRALKEQLLYTAIGNCLDTWMAMGALEGTLGPKAAAAAPTEVEAARPPWEPSAIALEQALLNGDAEQTRRQLQTFLDGFRTERLLFTALADGGQPGQILRVRTAQAILRALVVSLPRLGLLRETLHLLLTARDMEQAHPLPGRGVTEFNQLFHLGYQAVVEAVVDAAAANSRGLAGDQEIVDLLEALTRPFLRIWVEHSQTLQLTALESVSTEAEWEKLRAWVQRYGHDLFHAKFMTLANLRGILHRGIGAYLDYLRDNPDPLHPVKLIEELDQDADRAEALRILQVILGALVENYEEYKDYNTTTPQSDYGENLHMLLDFLRLKASYERHAWRLRPLMLAHEVLARRGRADLAVSWQEAFTQLTEELATRYLEKLALLVKEHGMQLPTVADRLQERFVQSLALDRMCASIEPAMAEVREKRQGKSFARLERELQPLKTNPTGVGLDVPQWLRRLEAEVRRVHGANSTIALMAEDLLSVPRKPATLENLKQQVEEWDKPSQSD